MGMVGYLITLCEPDAVNRPGYTTRYVLVSKLMGSKEEYK